MLILSVRTDKPEAEIGIYKDLTPVAHQKWLAHRQLAETLHQKISDLLEENHFKLTDIEGIIVYRGPGSYTGLRLGISVTNALSYGLNIPIAGGTGGAWIKNAVQQISQNPSKKLFSPLYDQPAKVTIQTK